MTELSSKKHIQNYSQPDPCLLSLLLNYFRAVDYIGIFILQNQTFFNIASKFEEHHFIANFKNSLHHPQDPLSKQSALKERQSVI